MPSKTGAPAPQKFIFSLDHNFAAGAIQIDPSSNPELLASLAANGPLPAGDHLIAGGDLQVAPGHDITAGPAKIGFSADVNAALGIYETPGNLRKELLNNVTVVAQLADQIVLPAGQKLLLLRWGYDISGTASGTVALGPTANVSFSASEQTKGYFAVVQGVAADAKADCLNNLIQSWKLPSQVDDIAQMPPSTTLISEVDGSFSAGAKVSFGYNFNWIRAVDGLGLKGDVGLKLQTALSASLGFGMSGKYAVMLSRENADPKIRMRLYKLRISNWNLGFDTSLTATGQAPAPDSFDDLVKAITGTHHQQIMKLLGDVTDWTDPSKPVFGPFVNLSESDAQKLIQSISGIGDLASAFDSLKARIQKLFSLWDSLPQKATQLLWSKLPDQKAITGVAGIAQQVSQLSDDNLTKFIESKLTDAPFLDSDEGKALASFATNGLFSALQDSKALADIKQTATNVANILDGDAVQQVLSKLQAAVSAKLDLKQLETVVDQASFDSLDTWLKARLEDFLEHKLAGPNGLAELTKLRNGLHSILTKTDDLYSKALAALKHNYAFSLSATYQSTATTSALLDVVFDFGVPNSQAGDGLKLALSGKFDQLLEGSQTGVTLNQSVLAFGLHRESHVSISLPYFSTNSIHVNDAVAQLQTVSADAGGLAFSLQAADSYTVKNDYSSALTIALTLPGKQQVNVHSPSASYRYDLKAVLTNLTSEALSRQFGPYASEYFAGEFAPPAGSFADWTKQIAPSGKIGNALVTLSVSMPASAAAAWMKAPRDQSDAAYKRMSIALQRQFKQVLHDTFFSDLRNYRNVSGDTTTAALLAFCSIQPCSDIVIVNDGQAIEFQDETATGKTIYWDYRDRGENAFSVDLRKVVLFSRPTQINFLEKLRIAQQRLQSAGDPDHVLPFYRDDAMGAMLRGALEGRHLDFLFPVEANMVEQARTAGLKLAAFRASQFANPEDARKSLAAFGQKLSEDFNTGLRTFAVNDALLPLGTAIYAAGARSLDPNSSTDVAAMFTVEILKAGVSSLTPQDADVLRTQRVVHGTA